MTEDPDLRIVIYSNYQRVELRARAARIGVPFLAKGNLRALRAAVLRRVSAQQRVQRSWAGPAAIVVIALLAAAAVLLFARDLSRPAGASARPALPPPTPSPRSATRCARR